MHVRQKLSKLLKNQLWNIMGQDQLASLVVLAIKNERLKTLDFSDVTLDFAELK